MPTATHPTGNGSDPRGNPPPGEALPTATPVVATRSGGRTVALTFDDGPDPEHTPRLLSVLREHRVPAVFCLIGAQVRDHPELVRRIAADGHQLANHTMHHDDLTSRSPDFVRADLAETSELIGRAVPGAPVRWFRAPYGNWGPSPRIATELGMRPLGWQLAVHDWEPPGVDELVDRLARGVTPGAVVLLHDGGGDRSQTVEAVDRVIPMLRARGWRFDLPADADRD
ncbi:polysaccharide deacetylase family protein [Streptomyces sp. NPDC092296]|uniref:polysaccharide deacetylase family protein n=1 Tax=Streptomyces sp. NPDC092296 TaxID=3366012 RepID=UPI00380F813D